MQSILAKISLNSDSEVPEENEIGVEATAWAILAMKSWGENKKILESACRHLSKKQSADGRLAAVDGHPEAYWPTSLALLSWLTVEGFEIEIHRAIQFLLANSGTVSFEQDSAMVIHDLSIKGWSWTENTYSWIEPTTMGVLALKASGYGNHNRAFEAIRLILNRQLPNGGWNYGNTMVFGKQLMPIPEYTGKALCALGGYTEIDFVKQSINYLNQKVKWIRTPQTLAWSIFGLKAWSVVLPQVSDWIIESLSLQSRYGKYNTVLLSQLLIAYFTSGYFFRLFSI